VTPAPRPPAHRIIIPVYIPHDEGYFAHARQILRMVLTSVRATTGPETALTLVFNGCTRELVERFGLAEEADWIDRVIVNRTNRGRIDTMLAGARGSTEELITLADGDVLFTPGWIEALTAIFAAFPECGFVTPSPNPRFSWSLTSATVLGAFVAGELGAENIVPARDLDRFALSVGSVDWFTPQQRSSQLIVRRGSAVACVGGGHYVFTLRRPVLEGLPPQPILKALGESLEKKWIDEPVDRLGFWKLSTTRAYAYHLGNVPEPWMQDLLGEIQTSAKPGPLPRLPVLRRSPVAWLPWMVRVRVAEVLRAARTPRRPNPPAAAGAPVPRA
jgi:hypothetical protein